MTIEDVLMYFGSGIKTCAALEICHQNFTHWRNQGYIPEKQQLRIEMLTKGKLKADKKYPKFIHKENKRFIAKATDAAK